MMYTTTTTIIDDLLAVYDNQTLLGTTSTARRARMLNYVNRTADELWNLRDWSFKFSATTLNCVSGNCALPGDFYSVEGVWDANGESWTEISYTDLLLLRAKNERTRWHYYAISANFDVVDVTSNDSFTMIYKTALVTFSDGSTIVPPFNPPFGRAIYLGAAAKLRADEADKNPTWMQEYLKAQSELCKTAQQYSRMTQMPMTTGSRRW